MIAVEPLVLAALIVALLIAPITDIRTHKIPNWVTFPVIFLALLVYSKISGFQGLLFSAEGLGRGFILLLPFHLAGGTGAGDVKLLAATGAALGPGNLLCAFLTTGIVGLVLAAGALLFRPEARRKLVSRVYTALPTLVLARDLGFSPPARTEGGLRLPYGAAISLGALAYIFWEIHRGGISIHPW
jgi:prepilin peptidase CpaA